MSTGGRKLVSNDTWKQDETADESDHGWTPVALLSGLRDQYGEWTDETRQQAMAEAYRPIVRGFLLPAGLYYLVVTLGHFHDEVGFQLLFLVGNSLGTAILYGVFRTWMLPAGRTSLNRLETIGLMTNLLMYGNTAAYMYLHFEEQKLIYFVLMAVVFSTTGVTLRATLASVLVSIASLFWFARQAPPDISEQFAFIGVATSFASFGMATLLRKAIMRQIDARLSADQLAAHDSLTGIANRRSLFSRVEGLVLGQQPFWIGILDLDGFKSINDIYGHATGDHLLRAVAERLSLRRTDSVEFARIGGDEFAIVMTGEPDQDEVVQFGNCLIQDISQEYEMQSLRLSISGTIGFAHFPTMGADARDIYEKADFSLYRAKQVARHQPLIFSVGQDKEMRATLLLERALREAKLEDELFLLFQPQMDITRTKIVSFEALARWQSPVLGPVAPDMFIRAAERAGLIQNVSRVLFVKALDALEFWPSDISVSFNLSAQDLADRAFIFSLVEEVRHRNISPSRIEFEITETAVMKDIATSRVLLEDLSAAGFKIALDDFGSGYSSFEYIDQLPLDKVKIDKSFVRKVAASAASREIVAGVITLWRNLGLKCVLEGVETEDEMQILAPLSPPLIQGYLYGKPMPQRDVLALLLQAKDVEAAASAA